MAMHVPKPPGFAQMMKEGSSHYSGLEEAVYRNIEACRELTRTTKSTYGPNGQNKMVINHLEKLFVTNDAATILRELEVEHPAAKMLVMASQEQEAECGDGTNFVMILAGTLLHHAEELLRMGLPVVEVIEGYEKAMKKAQDILPDIVVETIKDLRSKDPVRKAIRSAIMSKQYGKEDFLADLITDACLSVVPETSSPTFNVDNVRVCKISGSGVLDSTTINGMVFKRAVEGNITKVDNCKVAVYSCPLDMMQTETKGTVLIKTAQELLDYSKGEESIIEEQIKAIVDTGCKVIVTGGKVGDLTLHYCNAYKVMVIRLMSKFDVRRLCKAIGATALPRVTAPTAEESGHCDHVYVDEIGETPVVIFKQEKEDSAISTIVVRGSTDNIMDDIERAIDDGVNTFKALTKDARLVPGAGATEMELAKQLRTYGETCPGLDQYAIKKFGEALEAFPVALADNTGVKSSEVLSMLYAAHQEGKKNAAFDIEGEGASICDAVEKGIVDLYLGKYWGLKFATVAACTVLKVDQIIMSKQAGGPKPKENPNRDDD